ncbi:MAG: WavE lipopolysaccharide synthesis family protein [Planctomycetia bacterium]|nr:WavE lipopolysaccharide synthesis family protein [Planctomycetia bacterium]
MNVSQRDLRLQDTALAILSCVLRLLPVAALRGIFRASMQALHRKGPFWITMHRRPKSGTAEYYRPVNPLPIVAQDRYAVVLQGPLLIKENFTLETIRYYRATYPEALLILSTWKGEDAATIALCKEAGSEVVLIDKPTMPGAYNLNLQALSTLKGLEKAQELGCRFAAKTRTDMRVFAPNAFTFLINLSRIFPLKPGGAQKSRIIATSWCTARYNPFQLADFFLFGLTEDLIRYWECPLNEGTTSHAVFGGAIAELISADVPEIYLCRSYLERTFGRVEVSLKFWWRALADKFLIVDFEMLDIYWHKYHPHTEYISRAHENYLAWNQLTFRDWLQLMLDFDAQVSVPEQLLKLPCRFLVPAKWPDAGVS